MICAETESFLYNHGVVRIHYGTANQHNSNSLGELTVKRCVSSVRALMCSARCPLNLWDFRAQTWCMYHNGRLSSGTFPERRIPFSTAGTAIFPPHGSQPPSKLAAKRTPCIYLGPVIDSSNSCWVLYYNDRAKRFSHTSVMNRDVDWGSEFGFAREYTNLQRIDRWLLNDIKIEYAAEEEDWPTLLSLLEETTLKPDGSLLEGDQPLYDLWSYSQPNLQDVIIVKEGSIPTLTRACVSVIVEANSAARMIPTHAASKLKKDIIMF